MNRAVIYSRVSTNEQTVENQLKVLREVAEKKGLEVVREISDEGISGAKGRDERLGFDELIKGSIKNEWDIILVWDVSRLGRPSNLNEGIVNAVRQLRENKVPIKRIAKDLHIGVGTVYKILDKVA